MNNMPNPIIEEIIVKFRENNAVSKETSKSLAELGIFPQEQPEHKLGLKYLKGLWQIRKYKGNFYLDENAIKHPLKALFKKFLFTFSIMFPLMIIIFALMAVLIEFKII